MKSDTPITSDDLQAFADDALTPSRRADVAAYIAERPDAAAYVERIFDQNARLRAAAGPFLDPSVPSHLRVARLFDRKPSRPWSGALAARPQIAAALVVGLLAGGMGGWSLRSSQSPFRHGVRPLVEEAADTYAVYAPDKLRPIEVAASDKDGLMRWVRDRLHRSVSAPDAIASYKLMGGRVVATTRGPAAMFMYDHGAGQRIVLMICPLSLHGHAPITSSDQGDLMGVSWSDKGVGYSLVGALTAGELERLGSTVRQQTDDKA